MMITCDTDVIRTIPQMEAKIWSNFNKNEREGLLICHEALKRARGILDDAVSRDGLFKSTLDRERLDDRYFSKLMDISIKNRAKRIRKLITALDKDCFLCYNVEKARCVFTYEGFIDAVNYFENHNNRPEIKEKIKSIRRYNTKAGLYVMKLLNYLRWRNNELLNQNLDLQYCNTSLALENKKVKDMRIKQVLKRMGIKAYDDAVWKIRYVDFLDTVRKECPKAILTAEDNMEKHKSPYKNCYVLDENRFKLYIKKHRARFFKN